MSTHADRYGETYWRHYIGDGQSAAYLSGAMGRVQREAYATTPFGWPILIVRESDHMVVDVLGPAYDEEA